MPTSIEHQKRMLKHLEKTMPDDPAHLKLDWTKNGRDWFAIWGKFRADVQGPSGPLSFCRWYVHAGDRQGGSGATSSIQASKRAAEIEVVRFAKFLRTEAVP